MSPEERQMLVELFQRVNGVSGQPRDKDAEAFINEAVRLQPYSPYVLAQTVIVQEQTLRAAGERIQQLEAENAELQARAQQPQQTSGGFLGGLGSLLGGAPQPQQRQPAPPVQGGSPWGAPAQQQPPQQAGWGAPPPAPQPGPWGGAPQQGGGGFLKGALGAAAGVAGGVLLANSLSGLFRGHGASEMGLGSGLGGLGSQAGLGGGETVINNYYGDGGMRQASDEGYDNGGGDDGYQQADYDDGDDGQDDDTYDA